MIKKFIYLLGKEYNFLAIVTCFLIIISTFLEVLGIGLIPILISYIIDPLLVVDKVPDFLKKYEFFIYFNNSHSNLVLYGSILIFIIFFAKNLLGLFTLYLEAFLSAQIRIKNSKKLLNYYLYLPYLFHSKKNSSSLIRNMLVGINNSAEFVISFIRLFKEIIFLTIIFSLLIYVDIKVTIFSGVILIVSLIFYIQNIKKKAVERGKQANQYATLQIKLLRQSLGSIKETKVYGVSKKFLNLFNKNNERMQKNSIFYKLMQGIPKFLLEQVSILIILSVTVYLFVFENQKSEIIAILSLFTIASIRMIPVFNAISITIGSYRYRKASFDIIYNEFKSIEKLSYENKSKSKIQFKKYLKLENITFAYLRKKKILRNINLIIKKNSMVSIIGKSGTGKTTLINIILGLITPHKGMIYFDNKTVKLNNYNWQKKIGYVAQDVFIMDESIKNNILFGRKLNYSKRKINNLIKFLNLDDLIKNLDNGINTKVGDKGSRISGGEKQRIGIARALLSEPELLVLDEATASLDAETEEKIIKNIKRNFKKTTIINVSHRQIPIKYSDKIIRLDNSKTKIINK